MIARWHLALVRRATVARIPLAESMRRFKRQVTGYLPTPANIASTFADLQTLYNLMNANSMRFGGTVLEIGSGWFPIAGIIARLNGADRVILSDVTKFMDQQTFEASRQIVLHRLDEAAAAFAFDPLTARTMLNGARTPAELKLTYMVPFDIAAIPDGSLDVVISRACLEHIPVSDLEVLMAELRPKLKASGFMAHSIDNTDHFSHIDRRLSRVNFLTWSKAKHRFIWQLAKGGENRLRHHEYADLFRRSGYDIIAAAAFMDNNVLQDVSYLNLTSPYNRMTAEEIAVTTSWYVLRTSAAPGFR